MAVIKALFCILFIPITLNEILSISELMKSQLLELRDLHLKYTAMRVKLESYPKQVLDGSVKSLKYCLNSPELYEKLKSQNARDIYGVQGVQGSFRKLEID